MQNFSVLVASEQHIPYIQDILSAIEVASKVPGNSIVMRDPTYLATKMREGKAVIALCDDGSLNHSKKRTLALQKGSNLPKHAFYRRHIFTICCIL